MILELRCKCNISIRIDTEDDITFEKLLEFCKKTNYSEIDLGGGHHIINTGRGDSGAFMLGIRVDSMVQIYYDLENDWLT